MLSMMVYWDDDKKKKPKVEGSLRSRRHEGMEEPSIGLDLDKLVEVLNKQTALVDKQSDRIQELTEALTKALDKPVQEISPHIVYVDKDSKISHKERDEDEDDLPTLKDRDVQVISTAGIEIGTEPVGDKKSSGEDIRDKVAKLKQMRGKKHE